MTRLTKAIPSINFYYALLAELRRVQIKKMKSTICFFFQVQTTQTKLFPKTAQSMQKSKERVTISRMMLTTCYDCTA